MRSVTVSLLLVLLTVSLSEGVIHGPRETSKDAAGQPVEVEIGPGDGLEGLALKALQQSGYAGSNKHSPTKRASDDEGESDGDELSTTTPLPDDNHSHGVVHWTGYPSQVIFIVTRKRDGNGHSTESWVWRSTDYGHTFVNETDKLPSDAVVEWYYVSSNETILVFADIINDRIYVTETEGETYTTYSVPFKPYRILFQRSSLVLNPLGNYILGYDSDTKSLHVTSNIGKDWTSLANEGVTRYYWRVLDAQYESSTSVYFEVADDDSGTSVMKNTSEPYDNVSLFPGLEPFITNTFVLSHEYMLVQREPVTDSAEYSSPLWVSHSRGPFEQAQFPLQIQEKHYALVDASEGQVFIAVYHDINNTNLYLSEEAGLLYSLSLEQVVGPPESSWINAYPAFDVHNVEGIVGTYFANRVTTGGFGSTVVTYDKGGEWLLLAPPAVDHNNNPIVCTQPDCSLHLHMSSDVVNGFQSILSQDSAIGLIMATGNIGPRLETSTSSARIYFSHDGGFSWQEVTTGQWVFQFAGQGSLVVMVRKYPYLTNSVMWTCDEGMNWQVSTFSNSSIYVVAMFTESGEKALHTTIFGFQGFPFTEWLIIDLNFGAVLTEQCSAENYTVWIPSDERLGKRCVLGESVQYERRKTGQCCYVDPSYEKIINRTVCECAKEDFECDFGFERLNLDSPCTPMDGTVYPPAPPTSCPENTTYSYTSGYRKVAEDKCVIGEETFFLPVVAQCPVLAPWGMLISFVPPAFGPNEAVMFTLKQYQGGTIFTWYQWDFGDGSLPVSGMGLENINTQEHTYSHPGVYGVTVTAMNNVGSSNFTQEIHVLDAITNVSVTGPAISLPTTVLYNAFISTKEGTPYYEPATYQWMVDGRPVSSVLLTTELAYTFKDIGDHTVAFSVSNGISSKQALIVTRIERAADSVMIVSEDLIEGSYVGKNSIVTFKLQVSSQDQVIPEGTEFTWYFDTIPSTSNSSMNTTEPSVSHRFSTAGRYLIVVNGNYGYGSFVSEKPITVQNVVFAMEVAMAPIEKANFFALATVMVWMADQQAFEGEVLLQVTSDRSTSEAFDRELQLSNGTESVDVLLEDAGDYMLTFTASNFVSNNTFSLHVSAAAPDQYGSIRFFFDMSGLEENYHQATWKNELRDNILEYLISTYKLSEWQFRVLVYERLEPVFRALSQEEPGVVKADPQSPAVRVSGQGRGHKVLRRQQESSVPLVADVTILPSSLEATKVEEARGIAEEVNSNANSGALNFEVEGESVAVKESVLNPDVIVEPASPVAVWVWVLVALGGLALVLCFAIPPAVGVYHYRKKYSRLQVRYSRLQQDPVRFTLNKEGELVEDTSADVATFTMDEGEEM